MSNLKKYLHFVCILFLFPILATAQSELQFNRSIPLLPTDVLQEYTASFSSNIQRSYEPGIALESTHFWVEADAYWKQNATELLQVVQALEMVRNEAETVASLWRSEQIGRTDFSGERIRLRIVLPGTPRPTIRPIEGPGTFQTAENHPEWGTNLPMESPSPCRLEQFDEGTVLTLEAGNFQDLQNTELNRLIRAELFQSMLLDGKEADLFPFWIQEGLKATFAGEKIPSSEEIRYALPVFQLPVTSMAGNAFTRESEDSANLWVHYFLTSDDGKNFFPFFELLKNINQISEKTEDSRLWLQRLLSSFSKKLEYSSQGENLSMWRLEQAAGSVKLLWNNETEILNSEVKENQPLPKIVLSAEQKQTFEEMALILKIASLHRSTSMGYGFEVNGVKIYEFGKPHQLAVNTETKEENSSAIRNQPANSQEREKVTPEDLQKLEEVYSWFTKSPESPVTLNWDGTILSARLNPKRIETLFHPKERAYLLQEYDGKPVLSAALPDGYTMHVIAEESQEPRKSVQIRILGVEKPEKQ